MRGLGRVQLGCDQMYFDITDLGSQVVVPSSATLRRITSSRPPSSLYICTVSISYPSKAPNVFTDVDVEQDAVEGNAGGTY